MTSATYQKIIIMQVGDKVKHVNMGEYIFTIKKIHENTIATIKRPIELITKLNPNTKSCDKVNDIYICKIENLIKITITQTPNKEGVLPTLKLKVLQIGK